MSFDLVFGKTKRDWSCGSVLLPEKQQKQIFNKIDDVRYDIRRTGNIAKIGFWGLSASIGFLAVTSLFRTVKGR